MKIINSIQKFKESWNINTPKIIFITVMIMIFMTISALPYINVFVPKNLFVFVVIFITLLLFKIQAKSILVGIIVLFILSGFFEVLRLNSISEYLGELIYFALVYTVGILITRQIKGKN